MFPICFTLAGNVNSFWPKGAFPVFKISSIVLPPPCGIFLKFYVCINRIKPLIYTVKSHLIYLKKYTTQKGGIL